MNIDQKSCKSNSSSSLEMGSSRKSLSYGLSLLIQFYFPPQIQRRSRIQRIPTLERMHGESTARSESSDQSIAKCRVARRVWPVRTASASRRNPVINASTRKLRIRPIERTVPYRANLRTIRLLQRWCRAGMQRTMEKRATGTCWTWSRGNDGYVNIKFCTRESNKIFNYNFNYNLWNETCDVSWDTI